MPHAISFARPVFTPGARGKAVAALAARRGDPAEPSSVSAADRGWGLNAIASALSPAPRSLEKIKKLCYHQALKPLGLKAPEPRNLMTVDELFAHLCELCSKHSPAVVLRGIAAACESASINAAQGGAATMAKNLGRCKNIVELCANDVAATLRFGQ